MRVRRISMATRIFLLVSSLLLVSDVFIGVIFYKKARSLLVEQMLENTKNMAATVGASIDGKDFEEAKKGDTESAENIGDINTEAEKATCISDELSKAVGKFKVN